MTEQPTENQALEMVECALSGLSIEKTKAIEYPINGNENNLGYVEPNAALSIALTPPLLDVIIEKIALNKEAFELARRYREVAIARNEGVQEGANALVKQLKETAAIEGKEEFINEMLSKAFPAPKQEVKET